VLSLGETIAHIHRQARASTKASLIGNREFSALAALAPRDVHGRAASGRREAIQASNTRMGAFPGGIASPSVPS